MRKVVVFLFSMRKRLREKMKIEYLKIASFCAIV